MSCRIWTLPDGTEVHAHVADDIGPESILAVEAVAQAAAKALGACRYERGECDGLCSGCPFGTA